MPEAPALRRKAGPGSEPEPPRIGLFTTEFPVAHRRGSVWNRRILGGADDTNRDEPRGRNPAGTLPDPLAPWPRRNGRGISRARRAALARRRAEDPSARERGPGEPQPVRPGGAGRRGA